MTSPAALLDYKKDEAMVIGLTAFFPNPNTLCHKLMAQAVEAAQPIAQPQSLANELSTIDNVRLFAETIYTLHEGGFPEEIRPREYQVHEISIIKRYLFVQHEALVVEIRHAPPGTPDNPNPEPAEPPFFILIDRTIFCSSMSSGDSSNDRVICSQQRPSPYLSTRIWGLRPAVGHQNLGINVVQLAIALRSTVEYAPHYNALDKNCFWFTYVSTTLIQRHILMAHTFVIDIDEKCLFHCSKLFIFRIGVATLEDIAAILQRYNDRFQRLHWQPHPDIL